jgi:hypothetical protein
MLHSSHRFALPYVAISNDRVIKLKKSNLDVFSSRLESISRLESLKHLFLQY